MLQKTYHKMKGTFKNKIYINFPYFSDAIYITSYILYKYILKYLYIYTIVDYKIKQSSKYIDKKVKMFLLFGMLCM